jgi:hypothetical protein
MTSRRVKEVRASGVKLTEREFTSQVSQLARTLGYQVYHPWLSIHSERGFPDLVIWKYRRFILAELKTDTGKLSPAQEEKLEGLKECGLVEVYIWRPAQWDEIVEILTRG